MKLSGSDQLESAHSVIEVCDVFRDQALLSNSSTSKNSSLYCLEESMVRNDQQYEKR